MEQYDKKREYGETVRGKKTGDKPTLFQRAVSSSEGAEIVRLLR